MYEPGKGRNQGGSLRRAVRPRLSVVHERSHDRLAAPRRARAGIAASRPVFSSRRSDFRMGRHTRCRAPRRLMARVEETTRCGLACRSASVVAGEQLVTDVIAEATRRFPVARDLLAGDELAAWLGRWEFTAEEWREYRRADAAPGALGWRTREIGSRFAGGADEVARRRLGARRCARAFLPARPIG